MSEVLQLAPNGWMPNNPRLPVLIYPPGQSWDLCRSAPTPEMRASIANLPIPATDPVEGASGPLTSLWRNL